MDPNVRYADDHLRELGAQLLEATRALRGAPDDAKLRKRAASLARDLRRGPVLQPGEILGNRFVLCERVRDGALAATWRAHDLDGDQAAAIKVLHGHQVGNAAAVTRFAASAAVLAKLDHPHIPRFRHELADHEGFSWYALDWRGDRTLEDATLAGELDPARVLQAALDVGEALAHAHAQGIRHEAVEPSKILLTPSGAVLTDPGLAAPGQLGSTYVAPESLDPGAEVGPAADIYGLAMTTVFALYGKALPYWVLRDPERLVASLPVDEAVRAALRSATSWDPEARPPTIAAFVERLTAPSEVVRGLAEAAKIAGRIEVAAAHYTTLVARTQGDPDSRVGLARVLVALDRLDEASEQLLLALRHERASAIDETLAELRTLSALTGRWGPLLEVLQSRAAEPDGPRAALLLEIGRIQLDHLDRIEDAEQAWMAALELHQVRAHAREAIEGLMAIAQHRGDWEAFLARGRALIPYLRPDARPPLFHRLGRVYLEKLADHQNGLMWLQRAHDGGYGGGELARTLERIRSDRGDWREVIRLMKLQAESQDGEHALATLRRAARIARFAAVDQDEVNAILATISDLDPHDAAAAGLRAQNADYAGDLDEALTWYARLPAAPPPEAIAAWMRDQISHARLMVHIDDVAGARRVLGQVLAVEPANLAALSLLGDVQLDSGELVAARATWEKVLAICFSEELSPMARHARLALSLVAWLTGDLVAARTHGHHVIEADAEDVDGWWAITRAALWALARDVAHSDTWIRATPLCFTPQEALTRLLAGTVTVDGMTTWLALDPLGAASLTVRTPGAPVSTTSSTSASLSRLTALSAAASNLPHDDHPLDLAAVVVEVLHRRGLIGAELFEEMAEQLPEAGLQVEAVRWLWLEEPTADTLFPVAESYTWTPTDPGAFDPGIHRTVLNPAEDVLPVGARHERLGSPEALRILLSRPEGTLPIEDAAPAHHAATPALQAERGVRFVLHLTTAIDGVQDVDVGDDQLVIGGTAPDLRVSGTEDSRGVLVRAGDQCYLTEGEKVLVDGVDRAEWRLRGGERIQVGKVELTFHALEPGEPVPVPVQPFTAAREPAPPAKEDDDLMLGLPVDLEEEPTVDAAYDEVPIQYSPSPPLRTDTQPAAGDNKKIRPILVILDGDQAGRSVAVTRSTFNIGRGRGNHLQISGDAKSSRHHATLITADGVCRIRDNKSANGTYVNGRRIREHILQVGDKILVGDRMLQFRLGGVRDSTTDELDLDPVTDEAGEVSLEELPPAEAIVERVDQVNGALAHIMATLDRHEGAGSGVAALQRLVHGSPARFAPLFTGVEVAERGLPARPLIENLEARLGTRQTLDAALLDLAERALARGCANLDEDSASQLIHLVARSNLRGQLGAGR